MNLAFFEWMDDTPTYLETHKMNLNINLEPLVGGICIYIAGGIKGKLLGVGALMEDTYDVGKVRVCDYTYRWRYGGQHGAVNGTV